MIEHQSKHTGQNDEGNPRSAPAEEAEGSAVIVDVGQAQDPRDEGLPGGTDANVAHDPELDVLIGNDDQ